MNRNVDNEPLRTSSTQCKIPFIISSTPSNRTYTNFSDLEISNVESHELNTCEQFGNEGDNTADIASYKLHCESIDRDPLYVQHFNF